MKKAILRIVAAFALIAMIALGYFEFLSRYQEGERYTELDNWQMYGDALIRFTKSNEHPADAIVVKAAQKQIDEYERQLRDGMQQVEVELALAMQGLRPTKGAMGLLSNGLRLLTFQGIVWPAKLQMSADEQSARVTALQSRLRTYEEYLHDIEAVRAPSADSSANR